MTRPNQGSELKHFGCFVKQIVGQGPGDANYYMYL